VFFVLGFVYCFVARIQVDDASCTLAGTTLSPTTKCCAALACLTLNLSYASEYWVSSVMLPDFHILRICTKTRDGERSSQEWRHACGRPAMTWIHQICRDTGVTATEALQLAEHRTFWQMIVMVGGFG